MCAKAKDKNRNSIANDKNITHAKMMFQVLINVILIITSWHWAYSLHKITLSPAIVA